MMQLVKNIYEERIKKLEELDKKKDVEITLLKGAIEHMKAEIEKLKAQLEKNKLNILVKSFNFSISAFICSIAPFSKVISTSFFLSNFLSS